MEKPYEKKITWTIKNFSSLQHAKIYSDQFVAGHCKWRLIAYIKGNTPLGNCRSLFLDVADSETLPYGWRRHTKFRLTVVNQVSKELSNVEEAQLWFDKSNPTMGFAEMLPHSNNGFIVNGEVRIVAEVDVLEVIAKSDVLEEVSVMESMNVNGFQVASSHVESVNSLFENHPDFASSFRTKNSQLRTTYLSVILSLNEILSQPSEELSCGDLVEAYSVLRFVTKAGFKLDWLEKKLKKEAGETRIQEIEKESKGLEKMHADMNALLAFLR